MVKLRELKIQFLSEDKAPLYKSDTMIVGVYLDGYRLAHLQQSEKDYSFPTGMKDVVENVAELIEGEAKQSIREIFKSQNE